MNSPLLDSFRNLRAISIGGLLLLALASVQAQAVPERYFFSHLAGPLGGPGYVDGNGPTVRFNLPNGIAADGAGNVYVADSENSVIRKITANGIVSTLAGTAGVFGFGDGTGAAARFNRPGDVAVDSAGNVYVADSYNHRIRKISPDGAVTTLAGGAPSRDGYNGSADGTGTAAQFYKPEALAMDNTGNIFVADAGNHTIRKITPTGMVTTLAGTAGVYGSADGGAEARFRVPLGIAVDNTGNILVADTGNNTIRKISPQGVVSTLAGSPGDRGSLDGTGLSARFNFPTDVAVDNTGAVFVSDGSNHTIRKISPGGAVTTLAGTAAARGSTDGLGAAAQFGLPASVAVDHAGNVFVADGGNHTIRKISSGGLVSTLAGTAGDYGSVNETGAAARFSYPRNVAVDKAGNIYVADEGNNTIRKITPGGVVSTLAGMAEQTGSTDGTGTAARFNNPSGVAVDSTGHVYVAELYNHTIRKITPDGVVTTFAGTAGVYGSADGTGTAALFYRPADVAVDSAGNVYVAEEFNRIIRKITPGGVVTTLAGTASNFGSADGTGPAAQFEHPLGVDVDNAGNVYVADVYNYTIRKITPGGVVTTLAGTAGVYGTTDGTGAAARFGYTSSVAVDGTGNVYVVDGSYHTIRKITPGGVVTTIGGTVGVLGSADGIGPAALFNLPAGVAVDEAGNLYVADSRNHAIRKGQLAGPPIITTQPLSQAVVTGNSVQLSVTASGIPTPNYQWYFNNSAFSGATTNSLSFTNARSSDAGDYTVVVTNELGSVTSNKATLAISSAPVVTPPPTPAPASGGGSIECWFGLALLALCSASRFATLGKHRFQ